MKTTTLNLFVFIPFILLGQNKYEEDAKFIQKHCNKESFEKAKNIYTELQTQQTNNSFDTTLNGFYQFLESTKCKEYNEILILAWKNDKVINEKSFKSFFKNSSVNYNDFIIGYTQRKHFRFANPNSFDQGIDDNLQIQMLKYVKSISNNDFNNVVSVNIEELEGHELTNFMSVVKSNFGLKVFDKEIIKKSYSANFPFDLDYLVSQLIDLKIDKTVLEGILTTKKNVWDKGNWSEKFWSLIKQNNLKINQTDSYVLNDEGKKKYDVKTFLQKQKENDLIGNNPLIFLNHNIFKYDENSLVETLEKLDIKDIEVKSKHNTTSLYGARGKDGVLIILTN